MDVSLIFQNLLGGALFGIWYAFPLCCVLTATGASCCYLLSHLFGRAVVMKYFSQRVQPLQKKVTIDCASHAQLSRIFELPGPLWSQPHGV